LLTGIGNLNIPSRCVTNGPYKKSLLGTVLEHSGDQALLDEIATSHPSLL
jgi:hypothetical protein